MGNWKVVTSFIYPHEASLAKAKLESEGITVILRDEKIVETYSAYSQAVGGIKVLVSKNDFTKAIHILIESGFIYTNRATTNSFILKFNELTSKLPIIGKSSYELRVLVTLTLLISSILVPILIFYSV